MAAAGLSFAALDGIAATGGPGLIGGVIVGVTTAKAIAAVAGKPFLAINHLEGHALSARLTAELPFPYLLLLVSGGHCQLLAVEGVGRYKRLGTTLDDAVGEAFDKCAKLLGLGYPGGPAIERLAREGNARKYRLPRPLIGRPGCDFSFSGLKTAVRQAIEGLGVDGLTPAAVADLAAGFQAAVADVLADRTRHALAAFRARYPGGRTLVAAGGVAANETLRKRLEATAAADGLRLLRAAAEALHRQRRHDRLGRHRAPAPRPHGRARLRAAAALAARPERPQGDRRGGQGLDHDHEATKSATMQRIGIVGAGAWGTALALVLHEKSARGPHLGL